TALEALHAVLELVNHPVHCDEGVARRGPGANDVTMPVHRHLADLPLGDARVALFSETDLGAVHAVEEAAQPQDLLLDRGAQGLGHLDVAVADSDLHATSWGGVGRDGSRARGPHAADLVFAPTLACRGGGRAGGGGAGAPCTAR